ncbi:kirola-like [Salvia hispanica]|uniref:kirola-like n=1 Tax=Salvia hispanica TaxID=49212 RepID=UPI00200982AD|nr:kirola-like [Salvia hispanica]
MGKLVSEINIRWKGDVFQLFLFPNHFSNICPDIIHSVDLVAGQWGTVDSIILWNYNIGGGKSVAKEIIEVVDKEKKSIRYKVIEGDVMQVYNEFKISVDVNAITEEDNLVTWTIDYNKKSEAMPEPTFILEAGLAMTKQIENHPIIFPN